MAHFAEIDETNTVIRVLVVPNEQEHRGQEYLADELGLGGTWIQTSYNNSFRKNFAGINYYYSKELDIFIPPKCHNEAELDFDTGLWNCKNKIHELNNENIIK